MKIGILGAGNVGGALGSGWAKAGHEVLFGVRDPQSPEAAQKATQAGARAASVAAAAAASEVVVLTLPYEAVPPVLAELAGSVGSGGLGGKVLLDATNPLLPQLAGLSVGFDDSAGEAVARQAPGARVVKIFNTTGFNNMVDPAYPEGKATMFYCGDDAPAKAIAGQLAADLGFDPVDAGPLSQARLLEPLALLWITLAYRQGLGRDIAFRLMRR